MGDVLITIGWLLLLLFPTIGVALLFRFSTKNETQDKINYIRQPRFLVEKLPQDYANDCTKIGIKWSKILQEYRAENKSFSYTDEEKKHLLQMSSNKRRHKIYRDYIRQPKFLYEPLDKSILPYAKMYKVNAVLELKTWREENGITVTDTETLIVDKQKQTKPENNIRTQAELEVASIINDEKFSSDKKNQSDRENNYSNDELRRF